VDQFIGVAEAKRHFSELVDRVRDGERIVIARRGTPVVALVAPDDDLARGSMAAPTGFAALVGALADWDDLGPVMDDIHAARRTAKDRAAPALD
jgi:prevent-host-death family protein